MKGIAFAFLVAVLIDGAIGSDYYKESPTGEVNSFSPLVTWEFRLETDSGGNASYLAYMDGKLYSIDTINQSLDQSTNVTVKRTNPYNTTIQTIDVYSAGNNTTYPRATGGEMHYLMSDLTLGAAEISITNGAANAIVPVFITIQRP